MPSFFIRLIATCLAIPSFLASAAGPSVTTEQVKAELVADAPQGIKAGGTLLAGLMLQHQPHWHTYWRNAGDSGLPTVFTWTLPNGASAGEIEWPAPKRLPVGPLVNYGYEERVLLPVAIKVPADFAGKAFELKLHADWLVCKEVCIPQSGDFALSIPAKASMSTHQAVFAAARAMRPLDVPATVDATLDASFLTLKVSGLPEALRGKTVDYFAENAGVIDHAGRIDQQWNADTLSLKVPLSPQRSDSPQTLQAVLVPTTTVQAVRIDYPVSGWVAPAPLSTAQDNTGAPAVPSPAAKGWLASLLLAFIGGLLLNLMPCVFPVLSLKVLGFARHTEDRQALVAGSLAYTAGVVVSFVALAALVLALRAGGEQLGWGFQLQSPVVVSALALLFTLIGINLAGVFEWRGVVPDALAGVQLRHPLADHALTGVLAVAIASPCTAPFMGAALGAAFTLPAAEALSIFAVLGLGMAMPYVIAAVFPGAARWLPRPSAWMERFKVLMAFPMFATVLWLVWVLGHQVGIDGAVGLLGLALALALFMWTWGMSGLEHRARTIAIGITAAVLAATVAWAWPALRVAEAPSASTKNARWQTWSPEAIAQANAQGRPVFVDFTAAWCISCQFNKRTTLANAELLADFDRKNVLTLRADWTRRDAAITRELTRLGRSGVPVYAIYAPGQSQPQLLSELPSVTEVRDAISRW